MKSIVPLFYVDELFRHSYSNHEQFGDVSNDLTIWKPLPYYCHPKKEDPHLNFLRKKSFSEGDI